MLPTPEDTATRAARSPLGPFLGFLISAAVSPLTFWRGVVLNSGSTTREFLAEPLFALSIVAGCAAGLFLATTLGRMFHRSRLERTGLGPWDWAAWHAVVNTPTGLISTAWGFILAAESTSPLLFAVLLIPIAQTVFGVLCIQRMMELRRLARKAAGTSP